MKEEVEALLKEAEERILAAQTAEELSQARIFYLGRKEGKITELMKRLPGLSVDQKRDVGPILQQLRVTVESLLSIQEKNFAKDELLDLTGRGKTVPTGGEHLLTTTIREIERIFEGFGFLSVAGPEIETERYNFDALNIPADHPAREMWDTLFVAPREEGRLMRTQTSAVQIRYMEKNEPPFQIISVGRVFRHEATDFSHEINFHQAEGLLVGEKVSMANLLYTLDAFFKRFFSGQKIKTRFRPSYFPFVEPGIEVDVYLPGKGWLEMGGAGLVHPKVFQAVKYPKGISGFAFGLGVERLAMVKYGVPDIRFFYQNDMKFLQQFGGEMRLK
ncbi:MAG: phenylalanine--tRNA ligase subunit alpha [Candidatus Harrisonbacteria bacterium]|nr:phenylalanine--tRNA ligase subunit alpha [Candidatus Harrisonbacteria bacterium]